MTIRVLLADDHPVFREGLRMMLDTVAGIEVVGAAADGAALVQLAEEVAADVAVVDLDMPVLDGPGAAAELLARRPGLAVLALTMHEDEAMVVRALRAGVRGYVLKTAPPDTIAKAVVAVAEGDTWLAGAVGELVRTAAFRRAGPGPFPELSPRETEVLELVARGLSNQAIARELFLSTKTVQNHVSTVMGKLRVGSRAEAVARARDGGLGDVGEWGGPPR